MAASAWCGPRAAAIADEAVSSIAAAAATTMFIFFTLLLLRDDVVPKFPCDLRLPTAVHVPFSLATPPFDFRRSIHGVALPIDRSRGLRLLLRGGDRAGEFEGLNPVHEAFRHEQPIPLVDDQALRGEQRGAAVPLLVGDVVEVAPVGRKPWATAVWPSRTTTFPSLSKARPPMPMNVPTPGRDSPNERRCAPVSLLNVETRVCPRLTTTSSPAGLNRGTPEPRSSRLPCRPRR